ncbi:MAG TPA: class I SAM-dependent methyltransferase [Bryobacteraceae bacterium]|nr:class I SAM-dependent methyltransferase [Bryobacteraceae bacterium]
MKIIERIALPAAIVMTALSQTPQHQHHPPQSAEEYLKFLNDPSRDAWQKPHEVVMALDLMPDDVVADIGAGGGYFARRFAHHVRRVYAVDIDAKLLEATAKGAPPNLETVLAAPDDPKLPTQSVDLIFFCDVLHHIENRPAYYPKLARALRPGGRIVVIDFYKKPLPVGPPEEMKLAESQVESEFAKAGFERARSLDLLPYQYFLIFRSKR